MATYKTYVRQLQPGEQQEITLVTKPCGEVDIHSIEYVKKKAVPEEPLIIDLANNPFAGAEYIGPPKAAVMKAAEESAKWRAGEKASKASKAGKTNDAPSGSVSKKRHVEDEASEADEAPPERVTKRRRAVGKTSFKCGGCGEEFGDKKVRRSHYKVDVCAGFDYGNPYKYIGVYDEDWRE